MLKEFMLYIRNAGDAKKALSPEEHLDFVKQCEVYIGQLKSKNKLIAAQPIVREGVVLSKAGNNWTQTPVDPSVMVQVGYYHLQAETMEEAIEWAKLNPEFAYVPSATIEIRPIKTKEEQTSFIYPR